MTCHAGNLRKSASGRMSKSIKTGAGHGRRPAPTPATDASMTAARITHTATHGYSPTVPYLTGCSYCTRATTGLVSGPTTCPSGHTGTTRPTCLARAESLSPMFAASGTANPSSLRMRCAKYAHPHAPVANLRTSLASANRRFLSCVAASPGRTCSSEIAARRLAQDVLDFGDAS